MEALSFTTSISSSACRKLSNHNSKHAGWVLKENYKHIVYCQSSGKATKKSSGVLRSSLIEATDHHGSAAIMDKGLMLAQPNGGGGSAATAQQAEIEVKDHHLLPNGNKVCGSSTESLVETANDNGIGIKKFLEGKTLFVTGATGFLGKVLIEKIIRTVPDVHKIFVLVKAKDTEAALERVQNEIIDGELFKCLKQQHGKSYLSFMLSKIVPVLGNVCQNNLGLDENIADMIAKDVDIIVNSAANTTFDERYDIALDINTCGPSRLMSFAKRCHKTKLFVQVSTAYVNGQRQGRVMEKPFYVGEAILHGTGLNVEDEIKLVLEAKQGLDDDDDDELLIQKMKRLGLERANKFGWQDAYVFTKAMGEMMIDSMRGDLPVVTIRPSVIESTCKEPFPGWIEGNRMMDPILLYYGKGQVTGFLADPNGVLDVVPADMVVNATIAAMAKHGADGTPGSNVYQIASSVVNPLGIKDLIALFYEYFNSSPCIDSKGAPVYVPRLKLFSSMEDFSSHLWREATDRAGLTAQNSRKASEKLESICKKSIDQTKYLANLYKPYTFYGGRFDSSNTRMLMECMSKEENRQFGFDVNEIDWKDYILNIHIPGLRKHVMKGRLG